MAPTANQSAQLGTVMMEVKKHCEASRAVGTLACAERPREILSDSGRWSINPLGDAFGIETSGDTILNSLPQSSLDREFGIVSPEIRRGTRRPSARNIGDTCPPAGALGADRAGIRGHDT